MALCVAVGVFAVGQHHHVYVHSFLEQHIGSAQRGLYAGLVAVVYERYVVGEAVYEFYLPGGERCSRRCHHVLYTRLVHRYYIEVSLDEYAAVLLHYCLLGKIEAVKVVALVVDVRLGRVYIFCGLGVALQCAAAERHHFARYCVYGEYATAPETVDHTPVLGFVAHAAFCEKLAVVARFCGGEGKAVASFG